MIEGTVKRLTDFGAFVEVLPGIDGLVHISQISHKRVENPKDVLKVGQEVTVKVLEVNAADERVSLSIKALEERPAQEEGEKQEKRQSRPRRPKQKKNATLIFQKLKLDSQWLTCLAISNVILNRGWDKSPSLSIIFRLLSKTQWLSGLYYADFISFYSLTQLVRRWDDEIEF